MKSAIRLAAGATLALATLPAAVPAALAEPTLELRVSGPKEIFGGDPESSSVDARGVISMGPVSSVIETMSEYPVVTMITAGSDVFVGTSAGGVFRVRGSKVESLVAPEKLVSSALAFNKGTLYVATGPDGKISAVNAAKKAEPKPYFDPEEKYVWAMLADGAGLIVATGEPGRVLKVGSNKKPKVLFDPKEKHIRALIRHPKRGVIAGGGSEGIVYQLKSGGGAYALYDSKFEEVTAFAVDSKTGDLYAAFVSESKKGAIVADKTIGKIAKEDSDDSSPITGSEVVRIAANGRVDLLWSSRRDGALGLAFDEGKGQLFITTGTGRKGRGRIYVIDTKNRDRLTLLARVAPPIASAVASAPTGGAILVGTAPAGSIVRLGPGLRTRSVYLSEEQELHRTSRIGRLWFDADVPRGSLVKLSLRTGNTKRQDDTWSNWSTPVMVADGGPVKVPDARYAQFKVELTASKQGLAPRLKSMHASVIRNNVPPKVTEVFMLRRGVYMRAMPKEESKEKTITVSSSAIDRLREGTAPRKRDLRVRQGIKTGMMTGSWRARDPNGDALLYRVELRNLADNNWQVLNDAVEHPFSTFDSRAYPDGQYQLRVTASDRPSNSPDQALSDQNTSEPFLIDNAPPEIVRLSATQAGTGRVKINASIRDRGSQLGDVVLSINGGPWVALPATDGLVDAKQESFSVVVARDGLPGEPTVNKGRNIVSVRVTDLAGNAATQSTSVTLK